MLNSERTEAKDVVRLIRSGSVPARAWDLLVHNNRWTKEYSVQAELVRSPKTPAHVAIRFLQHLYRHDLAKVVRDVNLPVNLRQKAEGLLELRLRNLAKGDKISLAKSGSNAIACALLKDSDLEVVLAALQNSRLREADLYPVLNRKKISPQMLEIVAKSKRWSRRYSIRMCLLRHPNTPIFVAYEMMDGLMAQDLKDIAASDQVPEMVRRRALRTLDEKVINLEPEEKEQLARYGKGANLDALARNSVTQEALWMLQNPELTPKQYRILLKRHKSKEALAALRSHRFYQRRTPTKPPSDPNRDGTAN